MLRTAASKPRVVCVASTNYRRERSRERVMWDVDTFWRSATCGASRCIKDIDIQRMGTGMRLGQFIGSRTACGLCESVSRARPNNELLLEARICRRPSRQRANARVQIHNPQTVVPARAPCHFAIPRRCPIGPSGGGTRSHLSAVHTKVYLLQ